MSLGQEVKKLLVSNFLFLAPVADYAAFLFHRLKYQRTGFII